MFVKKKGRLHVIVLLYVDDMIFTNNDDGEIAKLRGKLSISFEMRDLENVSHFLCLEVESVKHGVFTSQKGYVGKLYVALV